MRRLLIILLAVFFLFDIFLAIKLFNPDLASSIIQLIPRTKITVSSEIPNKKVSLTNEGYLNKKLTELDFWGRGKVNDYPASKLAPTFVTVEKLKFVLTEKPQAFGRYSNSSTGLPINYSYGQLYNPTTKEMTLIIHIDPKYRTTFSNGSRYTGVALFAIFNSVHEAPAIVKEGEANPVYRKLGLTYFQDLVKNPEKNTIFKID